MSTTHDCPYCGEHFYREQYRDLHRGWEHADELSDDEVAAFKTAYTDEEEQIRRFRLKALLVLVLVYFAFLMIFAIFA